MLNLMPNPITADWLDAEKKITIATKWPWQTEDLYLYQYSETMTT